MQQLEDLNLLDNFLFQEVACNEEYGEEFCRIVLGTILNREMKNLKVEVEKTYLGTEPEYHGIRLDALVTEMSEDDSGSSERTIFDLEPNLYEIEYPERRGRYYHSLAAVKNFQRGDKYRDLADIYVIFILPYDPFGKGRMLYTMETCCREVPELFCDDGMHTLFLYTKGKYPPSKELADMLYYIENSRDENVTNVTLERISQMVRRTKSDGKVGIRYMQLWEHDEIIKKQTLEQGIRILMETYREDGHSREETFRKVQEKYQLTRQKTEEYMNQWWH